MPDTVRAWKDLSYRAGLSQDEIGKIPAHPAGIVELSDEELKSASGLGGFAVTTSPICTMSETYRRSRCCP
jgi:mersacidin/lichenicidin family type 2 lantibiotic